jgi:hypothetical protein
MPLETTCKHCRKAYALSLSDLAKGARWWTLCPDCRPDPHTQKRDSL